MRSVSRIAKSLLLAIITGASCSDAATQVIVDNVVVSLSENLTNLAVGQSVQADAVAKSASGGALTGLTIAWSSSNPSVATVSSAGLVTGVAPGTAVITGSAAGRSAAVTVTVRIPAAQLFVLKQPSPTAQTGTVLAVQPVVQLRDASGLVVTQAGVVITAGTGPGVTVGGTTTATTDASGVATFTDLMISGLVGARNLTFSAPALPVATSAQITITVGPLAQLNFRTAPSTAAVSGDPITIQPIVGLADAWTNPISQAGVPITVAVVSGSGTLAGTALIFTNAGGAAFFANLVITGTGSHTLKFTTGTLTAATSDPIVVVTPLLKLNYEKYVSTVQMLADCSVSRTTADLGVSPFYCAEQQTTSDGGVPGYNAGDITLDATVAAPGLTKSARYHYNHPGDGCNSITLRRYIAFPVRQEIWSEFQVRWSANFTTRNDPCAPNDHKFIFGDTQADASGRWALYIGSDLGSTHTLKMQTGVQPGVADDQFYLNRNNHGKAGELFAENLWDGAWHTIRLHIKASTTTSSKDGIFQIWIDGALLHDQRGFNNYRNDGTTNPDYLWGLDFTHNLDDGPPGRDMYIWWGNFRLFGSDPGW